MCSGRSQVFYQNSSLIIEEKDCRSTIESCVDYWSMLIKLLLGKHEFNGLLSSVVKQATGPAKKLWKGYMDEDTNIFTSVQYILDLHNITFNGLMTTQAEEILNHTAVQNVSKICQASIRLYTTLPTSKGEVKNYCQKNDTKNIWANSSSDESRSLSASQSPEISTKGTRLRESNILTQFKLMSIVSSRSLQFSLSSGNDPFSQNSNNGNGNGKQNVGNSYSPYQEVFLSSYSSDVTVAPESQCQINRYYENAPQCVPLSSWWW